MTALGGVGEGLPGMVVVAGEGAAATEIATTLAAAGYQVVLAADVKETLARAAAADVALVDVDLPGGGGVDVCRRLSENGDSTNLPVFYFSGGETRARIHGGDEGGGMDPIDAAADGFLRDAASTGELLGMVRVAVRGKRAEDTLRASNRFYTDLLASITDAFFAVDLDARITYANPRAIELARRPGEEIVGRTLWEVFPAAASLEFFEQYQRARTASAAVSFEAFYPPYDGWYEVRAYPKPDGMSVFINDVSKRKRAEQALAESDSRFRRMSESNLIGINFFRTDGTLLDGNEVFLQATGYERADLASGRLNWRRMTPPEFTHKDEQALAELAVTGRCTPYHKEFVRKDGKRVPILVGAVLFSGSDTEGVSFVLDQTQQRRAEAERERILRDAQLSRAEAEKAQKRLAFLAQASATLAETLDVETTLTSLSRIVVPHLADICMVDLVVEGTQSLERVVVEASNPQLADALEAVRRFPLLDARGSNPIAEVVRTGKAFGPAPIDAALLSRVARTPSHRAALERHGFREVLCVPLSARGRTLGALTLILARSNRRYAEGDRGVAYELGRRAALALENARLYAETQAAARAREDLIAMVSHDLKNPVAAVLLNAGLLRRMEIEGQAGDRVRAAAESIKRASVRMKRLIGDLLDMAKLEAGQLSVEKRAEKAAELIVEAIDLHAPLLAKKGLRLDRSLPPESLLVSCDRDRVLQVFSNLLGNAMRYTREGGTLSVRAALAGDEVEFCVSDEGPGIPADQMPHLFDRFWRGGDKTREGAGLGLYISKGIIDAHGGRIWAECPPGGGSLFRFTLPTADPAPAPAEAAPWIH